MVVSLNRLPVSEADVRVINGELVALHGSGRKTTPIEIIIDGVDVEIDNSSFAVLGGTNAQEVFESVDFQLDNIGGAFPLANDEWGEWARSGLGPDLNVIKADSSNNTILNAPISGEIQLSVAEIPGWTVDASRHFIPAPGRNIGSLSSRVANAYLTNLITQNGTIEGNLLVEGNLTVTGTTTTLNTEELLIEDNIITLNSSHVGVPSLDAGIEVNRGSEPNARIIWDESADVFIAGISGSEEQLFTIPFNNSDWLPWTNFAASGQVNVLRLNASDDVEINATSAIEFQTGEATQWKIADGPLGKAIIGTQSENWITTDTTNGSDDARLVLTGADNASSDRAAWITLGGEESSANGELRLGGGDSGGIKFYGASNAILWNLSPTGRITPETTSTHDIGSLSNKVRDIYANTLIATTVSGGSPLNLVSDSLISFSVNEEERLKLDDQGRLLVTSGNGYIGIDTQAGGDGSSITIAAADAVALTRTGYITLYGDDYSDTDLRGSVSIGTASEGSGNQTGRNIYFQNSTFATQRIVMSTNNGMIGVEGYTTAGIVAQASNAENRLGHQFNSSGGAVRAFNVGHATYPGKVILQGGRGNQPDRDIEFHTGNFSASQRRWFIPRDISTSGAQFLFDQPNATIHANTQAGSDTYKLTLGAFGRDTELPADESRGACIEMHGKDHPTNPDELILKGGSTQGKITVHSSIEPAASGTLELGSNSNPFADIHVDTLHVTSISGIELESTIHPNDDWEQWYDNTGSGVLDVLRVDTSNSTELRTSFGSFLYLTQETNGEFVRFSRSGDVTQWRYGGNLTIASDSTDGDDDHQLDLCGGGGGASRSRGAFIQLFGREHASEAGNVTIQAASNAGASIDFNTGDTIDFRRGNTLSWQFDSSSHLVPAASGTYSIGSSNSPLNTVYTDVVSSADSNDLLISSEGSQTRFYLDATAGGRYLNLSYESGDIVLGTTSAGVKIAPDGNNLITLDQGTHGRIVLTNTGELTLDTSSGNNIRSSKNHRFGIGGAGALDINSVIEFRPAAGHGRIRNQTLDSADNMYLELHGGGGNYHVSRGAAVQVGGNESSFPGQVLLRTGNDASSNIQVHTNNVYRWEFNNAGDFVPQASGTYDVGSSDLPVGDIYAKSITTQASPGAKLSSDGSRGLLDSSENNDLRLQRNGIPFIQLEDGHIIFTQPVTMESDLNVSGTNNILNTEQLLIEDNIITLNSTASGIPSLDSGFEVNRGDEAYAQLLWDESEDYFVAGISGSLEKVMVATDSPTDMSPIPNNTPLQINSTSGTVDVLSIDSSNRVILAAEDNIDTIRMLVSPGGSRYLEHSFDDGTYINTSTPANWNIQGNTIELRNGLGSGGADFSGNFTTLYGSTIRAAGSDGSALFQIRNGSGNRWLFGDSKLTYQFATEIMSQSSDNISLTIGGGTSTSDGGYFRVYGNNAGATGSVELHAGNVSGGEIEFYTNNSKQLFVTDFGALYHTNNNSLMAVDGSPGSNTKRLSIAGGNTESRSNGAFLSVYGENHASRAGDADLIAGDSGDVTLNGNQIHLQRNNSTQWTMDSNGDLLPAASGILDLGSAGLTLSEIHTEIIYAGESTLEKGRLEIEPISQEIFIGGTNAAGSNESRITIAPATATHGASSYIEINGINGPGSAGILLRGRTSVDFEVGADHHSLRVQNGISFFRTQGTAGAAVVSDSSDTGALMLAGGQTFDNLNAPHGLSSFILSYGRSHATEAGNLHLGAHTSGRIRFSTGADDKWSIENDGDFLPAASGTYDIGAADAHVGTIYVDNIVGVELGSGGPDYQEETGTSATLVVNTEYSANNASLVTLTLPATATAGDKIRVIAKGAGGFRIAQNAGQTVHGNPSTTTGAGGYIETTTQYNVLEIQCITDDTDFVVVSSIGNFTVV